MNWKPRPTSAGEHVIAFNNTANGMKGFRHIEIKPDGAWIEPGSADGGAMGDLVYFGRHMQVTGYAKLTFPKSK